MSNAVTLAQSCLCPSIPAPGSKFSATFTSPVPYVPSSPQGSSLQLLISPLSLSSSVFSTISVSILSSVLIPVSSLSRLSPPVAYFLLFSR